MRKRRSKLICSIKTLVALGMVLGYAKGNTFHLSERIKPPRTPSEGYSETEHTEFVNNEFNANDSCPAIDSEITPNLINKAGESTVTAYAVEEILIIGNEVSSNTGNMIFKVVDQHDGVVECDT